MHSNLEKGMQQAIPSQTHLKPQKHPNHAIRKSHRTTTEFTLLRVLA